MEDKDPPGKFKNAQITEKTPSREKRRLREIIGWGFGSHQNFLIGETRERRPLGHEGQLEVLDDPIDHSIVGNEGDDAHLASALRALVMHSENGTFAVI